MITIVGSKEPSTSEYQAALELKRRILEDAPDLRDSNRDRLTIVVGAKCHGQTVRDLDLLLLGTFQSEPTYQPFLPFANSKGDLERPDEVILRSLCVIIEVKSHPADKVCFHGTQVQVTYSSRADWHNASQQNEAQKYSFINYLKLNGIQNSPWVTSLIWLINVHDRDLPKRPHNILGANATWDVFLNVIGQMNSPSLQFGKWYLDSARGQSALITQAIELFSKILTPTDLDRRRMEQINQRVADELNLQVEAGQRMLILRGRGGTGKTMRLLQLAKHLYDDQAARVLVLTYNRALVADIRRLMTLMGIGDIAAVRSIHTQTVHTFFYTALRALEIIEPSEDNFYNQYTDFLGEALEWLTSGRIGAADLAALCQDQPEEFAWDYIFIDEAQDWPEKERQVLLHLYSYQMLVVADGIDQLIRSQTSVNWRSGLTKQQVLTIPLRTCLRMKAGLTRFVAAVASEFGLQSSEWVVNDQVTGGRVIIYEGTGFEYAHNIFVDIIDAARDAGNEAVDLLFCVPPQMVDHTGLQLISIPAQQFRQWAMPVWDGVALDVRGTYPTDVNQLRIVQYDSCRGLEGWSVVLYGLDEFYSYKLQQLIPIAENTDIARLQAARWLLIPLTRAMDTLVIHLLGKPSPVRDALRQVAKHYPDFISWHNI